MVLREAAAFPETRTQPGTKPLPLIEIVTSGPPAWI